MAESSCEIGGISLPDCLIRMVEALLSTDKLFNIYQAYRVHHPKSLKYLVQEFLVEIKVRDCKSTNFPLKFQRALYFQ